jgi:hypothetical protein
VAVVTSRQVDDVVKVYTDTGDLERRRGGRQYNPTDTRLHVAYMSFDLREHPIGWMVEGLLHRHNRRRVYISSYHYGTLTVELQQEVLRGHEASGAGTESGFVDLSSLYASKQETRCDVDETEPGTSPRGSGSPCADTLRSMEHSKRLARASDSFFWVRDATDDDIAQHVKASGVDIAVDMMAHTTGKWERGCARGQLPGLQIDLLLIAFACLFVCLFVCFVGWFLCSRQAPDSV